MQAAGLTRSFQITNLFFDLSVAENLRLAAQILEPLAMAWRPVRASRIASARVDELLHRFALAGKAHYPAGSLSHGEQRRLEVAVALASKPKILLLDEPTQGMSHGDTEETAALIKSLAADVTVLLIEHDIGPGHEPVRSCDRDAPGPEAGRGPARRGSQQPGGADRLFRARLTMLDIRNLHTHYGPSHIIQGIDLTVPDGEVFGIFGRNGVGKTTLLKTVAGWIKPTAGEIAFNGERIDGLTADRIARRGVGFVPEDRRIFPGLTVEENLTLGFLQVPGRSAASNRAALEAHL